MNLHDLLLEKASLKQLGHFYILETSAPDDQAPEILQAFVETFIKNYYQKIEKQEYVSKNLIDHPDVYLFGQDSEEETKSEKPYKVEQAKSLARFFEFKPIKGKRKFCILPDAHLINSIIANKLLKLFEEPQGISTIFLLNPRKSQLLPTIHSRAIHLRIPAQKPQHDFSQWKKFLSEIKDLTPYQVIEEQSKSEISLSFWINELTSWESEKDDGVTSKIQFTKWLKNYQEMELFHQPTATKWALFQAYLRDHVFPRLN
jgi:hypothetical protein